jgi:coenzyme F420-reducing hydrogenase delta subunit
MSFEPKIVGFLCNWCSYAGADLAGTSRKKYAPNVRVVRVKRGLTASWSAADIPANVITWKVI